MELRHLRYFIAAAEEEHFGRASERLCISRPAVSQIVADLEREVGVPLFERLAHRVKLTAAGRVLLPRLQVFMNDLDESLMLTRRAGQGRTGSLSIGYGSLTLMHPLFKAAVRTFSASFPDVTLSLVEMPTPQQYRAFADKKIHAGFMHFGPSPSLFRTPRPQKAPAPGEPSLDWLLLQSGGLGVAVATHHALAGRKTVSFGDLAAEPFVVVPHANSSPGLAALWALSQSAGFEPHVVQEVGTIATQFNLVSAGMGIGLCVFGRHFTYPADVAVVPITGLVYPTSFVFGWVKGMREPSLDRMIEVVKLELQNLTSTPSRGNSGCDLKKIRNSGI